MKTMKKLLASALLVCILTAMLVVPAAAASGIVIKSGDSPVGDNLYYRSHRIGESLDLTAALDTGTPTEEFSWTITTGDSVTVAPSGTYKDTAKVTLKKAGTTTVTVKYPNSGSELTKVLTFHVFDPTIKFVSPVDTIDLNTTPSVRFTANVYYGGTELPDPVEWSLSSSTSDGAAIDNSGYLTVSKPGSVTVQASYKDVNGKSFSATHNVTVVKPITGVTVSAGGAGNPVSLNKGSSIKLSAVVTPDNASDQSLTWSSSAANVATVDSVTGLVTGVGAGDAVIRATAANGKYGEINVKVPAADATGIRIQDKNNLVIPTGGTKELKAALIPAHSTDAITWSSSDTNVATVDSTGRVTGVSAGDATITAKTASGKEDSCKITVKAAATGIDLKTPSLTLDVGGSKSISATIIPTGAYGDLTYTSTEDGKADPIFTVDKNGNVMAKRPGVGIVTVSAHNGTSQYVTVTVNEKKVTGIALNTSSVAVDSTIPLNFTVTPTGYTDTLEWTSGNTAYAEIISNSQIKGISKGEVNITVTARSKLDNSVSFTETFKIQVTAPPSKTGTLTLTASPNVISSVGGYSTLTAKVGNTVISNNLVTWSISGSSSGVATVNANGVVSPKSSGDVIITGVYDDVANDIRYTGSVLVRIAPIIVYGNYGSYDRVNPLYFTTNEVIHSWNPAVDRIVVDGYVLTHGQHCYVGSSPDGHVMVALNPVFLNQLSPAVVHTVQIGDPAAPATGYFRTYGYSSTIYGVRTGDESQPALWAALCFMSILGASAILVSRRKDWCAKQ